MLEIMRLMERAIQSDETMAESLMNEAERMQAFNQLDAANALRTLARGHRVKMLELQARLAVVRMDYFVRFHAESDAGT